MSIINFPERFQSTNKHVVDKCRNHIIKSSVTYSQDITSSGVNKVFSENNYDGWIVNSVNFVFSGATARDFSASIISGVNVIENMNDFLWFQLKSGTTTLWQKITLSSGFYTGTQIATELKNKMDANEAFLSLGVTFTVAYNNVLGTFTITPSAGTLKYIQRNLAMVLGQRDSIAGHLFGLTADTSFESSIVSNTNVSGLDLSIPLITQTGNSSLSYSYATPVSLSLDQAIKVTTGTAAINVGVILMKEVIS